MLGPLLAFGVLLAVPGGYDAVFVVSFCVAAARSRRAGAASSRTSAWAPRAGAASAPPCGRSVGCCADRRVLAPGRRRRPARHWSPSPTASSTCSLQRRLSLPAEVFPLFLLGQLGGLPGCWPSRSAGWPTGSAAARCSWPDTPACWSCTACCSRRCRAGWPAPARLALHRRLLRRHRRGAVGRRGRDPAGVAAQQRARARAERGGRRPVAVLAAVRSVVDGHRRDPGRSRRVLRRARGGAAARGRGCSSPRPRPAMVAVSRARPSGQPAAGCWRSPRSPCCVVAGGGGRTVLRAAEAERRGERAAAAGRGEHSAAGRRGGPPDAAPRPAQHRARPSYGKVAVVAAVRPGRPARGRRGLPASGCTRWPPAASACPPTAACSTTYQGTVLGPDLPSTADGDDHRRTEPGPGVRRRQPRAPAPSSSPATPTWTPASPPSPRWWTPRPARASATWRRSGSSRTARPYRSADVNFWGVTFATDDTLLRHPRHRRSRRTWSAASVGTRELTVLRENVECPSLSPDGTKVAYKKASGVGVGAQVALHRAGPRLRRGDRAAGDAQHRRPARLAGRRPRALRRAPRRDRPHRRLGQPAVRRPPRLLVPDADSPAVVRPQQVSPPRPRASCAARRRVRSP